MARPDVTDPEADRPAGVHLAGTLPAGADNGLAHLRAGFLHDPRQRRFAIVEFVSMRTITTHDEDGSDTQTPVARAVVIEPALDPDASDQLASLARKLRAKRTGQDTLQAVAD